METPQELPLTPDDIEAAKQAGQVDAAKGYTPDANPYIPHTPRSDAWLVGYAEDDELPRVTTDEVSEDEADWLKAAEDADARAVANGQAVYDLMKRTEVYGAQCHNEWVKRLQADPLCGAPSPKRPHLDITPADFRDFMAWFESYGGTRFGLQSSMEFEWFKGAVLVVVR